MPRELEETTIEALKNEVFYARSKYPGNLHRLAGLFGEVGELAQAFTKREGLPRVRAEALQVAATALRIYEEGDGDYDHA